MSLVFDYLNEWNAFSKHKKLTAAKSNLLQCFKAESSYSVSATPFAVKFPKKFSDNNPICFSDETGWLKLAEKSSFTKILAHQNSIFDLVWFDEDNKIATASADHTSKIVQIEFPKKSTILEGHFGSVLSVSTCPTNSNLLTTGGRDGNLHIWDLRIPGKAPFLLKKKSTNSPTIHPVVSVFFAHNMKFFRRKRRRPIVASSRRLSFEENVLPVCDKNNDSCRHSVSSAAFAFNDSSTIVSVGSMDCKLKKWDLRQISQTPQKNKAKFEFDFNSTHGENKETLMSLAISPDGMTAAVVSKNDKIHHCNLAAISSRDFLLKSRGGVKTNSFYIKTAFSPDGKFVVFGSTDHKLNIWDTTKNELIQLSEHSNEVSGVDWCPFDFSQLATCSDDNTVKKWKIGNFQNF